MNQRATDLKSDGIPTVTTSVKLPEDVWIAVKKLAAERRTSVQQIAADAFVAYLSEAEKAA